MRKPTLKSSKAKLWQVFSEYIRRRDKGICISCNKKSDWKETDAGHYYARTTGLALFFDPRNVNGQCRSCNLFRHGNLPAYALALKQKYGPNILEELDAKRREIKKYTVKEYLDLTEEYKEKLKTL